MSAEFTLAMIAALEDSIIFTCSRTKRFTELARALNGVTQKMLTQQLREMERNGLVERKVFAQVPPRVEYSLTNLGVSLRPVVDAMCRWGEQNGSHTVARKILA
jgi:DNA-binding HxlR family transcriptional regulator